MVHRKKLCECILDAPIISSSRTFHNKFSNIFGLFYNTLNGSFSNHSKGTKNYGNIYLKLGYTLMYRINVSYLCVVLLCQCVKYHNLTQNPGVEILWKGRVSAESRAIHPKLCGNSAFPQDSHTRKLGQITVFYSVLYFRLMTDFVSQIVKSIHENRYKGQQFNFVKIQIVKLSTFYINFYY